MKSLRWALIGTIATLLLSDWVRLRSERRWMEKETQRSIEIAERTEAANNSCFTSLTICKDFIETDKMIELTKLQYAENQGQNASNKRR